MADIKAIAEELVNLTVKEVNDLADYLKSELDQTLRFTLSFDMDGIKGLFGRN
jgi:hypothetical protein